MVHITLLIIIIAIFSNLIGALTALFFTNYCVGVEMGLQVGCNWIPEIGQLHQPIILSALRAQDDSGVTRKDVKASTCLSLLRATGRLAPLRYPYPIQ